MATWHISPTGDDINNSGTLLSPFYTLNKASTVANPGDLILVHGGVYNTRHTFSSSGTSLLPITIEPYDADVPYIDGTGISLTPTQAMVQFYGSYLNIYGLVVTQSEARGIATFGNSNLLIDSCTAEYCVERPIGGTASYVTVRNCTVRHGALVNLNYALGTGGWPGGIASTSPNEGPPVSNWLIEGNTIHDVWGEGILCQHMTNAVIRNNTVTDTASVNIYLNKCSDTIVERNWIKNTNNDFIRPDRTFHANAFGLSNENASASLPTTSNIIIRNNVVESAGRGISYFHDTETAYTGNHFHTIKILNNYFAGIGDYVVNIDNVPPENTQPHSNVFSGNVVYNGQEGVFQLRNHANSFSITYNLFANSIPSGYNNSGNIQGNPQITLSPLAISGTSIAIDAMPYSANVTNDYNGTARTAPTTTIGPILGIYSGGGGGGGNEGGGGNNGNNGNNTIIRGNMSTKYAVPVQKGKHVRVWLAIDGLAPDRCPVLEGCIIPGEVSFNQNTEVVKKKCPSPTRRGKFDVVYTVVSKDEPEITTNLTNRLSANMRSLFLKLSLSGCPFDMIYAYGVCSNPNQFNQFDKLEYFLGVTASNYRHDEVGAFDETTLTDDVLEDVEITASAYFEYARPVQTLVFESEENDTVHSVLFCDIPSCGSLDECATTDRSDGCQKAYALMTIGGVSKLAYSINGGKTWSVNTTNLPVDASTASITCDGTSLVVTASGSPDYAYALVDDILANNPTWVTVADPAFSGFNASWTDGNEIYFAGNSGALASMYFSNLGTSPTLVTGAPVGAEDYRVIDGTEGFVVAAGDNGAIAKIVFGLATAVTSPDPALDFVGVSVRTHNQFTLLASNGELYFTRDGGVTFTEVFQFPGTPTSLHFANNALGYALVDGYLYFTADGGCTWTRLSNIQGDSSGTITSIDTCDNGNYILYNTPTEIYIAEDKLRSIYGPI